MKVSDEGKELLREAAAEFICFLAGEANDTAHQGRTR
jgi:histone H3/H4